MPAADVEGVRIALELVCCADLIGKDDANSATAQKYAEQGMDVLHQAIANGYNDIEHLKTDEVWSLVRDRSDLQDLIAELEHKKNNHGRTDNAK